MSTEMWSAGVWAAALPGRRSGPGTNPNYPARCDWNVMTSQSLNLTSTAPSAATTWATVQATTAPMHYGDICNLGIACPPTTPDPRHLLDFNQETADPTTGCAHIGYADDNTGAIYATRKTPARSGTT